MSSEFVINEATMILLFICNVLIDILYFCAGIVVFMVLLTADFVTKNLDTKAIRIYAVCVFIVWCWIFSKLIVL